MLGISKKISKIIINAIILIILLRVSSYGIDILKIQIKADKQKIKTGEELKIVVCWDQGMQAADFSLIYDKDKLKYTGSNIEDIFVKNDEDIGEIKTAWISMDDKDITEITYYFKAIGKGNAKFTTKVNGGFATGDLEIPKEYSDSQLNIRIGENIYLYVIGTIVVVIIIILIIKGVRKIGKKKN